MFINSIDPVLVRLGIFQIRYYGIFFALGFLLSYYFLRRFITQGLLKNMDIKKLDDLILYLLVGIILGARILYFGFYDTAVFFSAPLEIIKIWKGGLSFHGGLVGVIIAFYLFSRKHHIKVLGLLDAFVVPGALGLAFGRIANFTNSELYGIIGDVPWCVQFSLVDNFCRHPYQLYASISHFITFGILLWIYTRSHNRVGMTFWSALILYGGLRIITDIFREEVKWFIGLSTGQVLSLIMVLIGGYVLLQHRRSKKDEPIT